MFPRIAISQLRAYSQAAVQPAVKRYNLDWRQIEDMKTHDGGPKFNIWREKYFFWLVGNSQEFIDQIRLDVATKLAEEEMTLAQDPKLNKEALINTYKERLKATPSVLGLLRAGEKQYVAKEFKSFTDQNRKFIDSAISLFNEKYLKQFNKNIPVEGELKKVFVSDFIRSIAFSQSGGRTRVLSHREIEKALLLFLAGSKIHLVASKVQTLVKYTDSTRPGPSQIQFLLNDEEFESITVRLKEEYKEIDKIKDYCERGVVFEGKEVRIEPKQTEAIVRLWQSKGGYKKDVNQANYNEISEFVLKAYKKGKEVVTEAYRVNPRILGKPAKEYIDGILTPAIERRLKNDPAARIVSENEIQAILSRETRKWHGECAADVNAMLEKIKMKRGERGEQYANRATKEVRRQIGSNIEMQKVAEPILERFMIDQELHQALEDVFGEMPEVTLFRGFFGKERDELKDAFRTAFFARFASLTPGERKQSDKAQRLELARSIVQAIREQKYKELRETGSVFDNINIPFVESLTEDEWVYFRRLSYIHQMTVATILERAYKSFLKQKNYDEDMIKELGGEWKDTVITVINEFKSFLKEEYLKGQRLKEEHEAGKLSMDKYLINNTEIHAAIDVMASDKHAHVQSLLSKLKTHFGLV